MTEISFSELQRADVNVGSVSAVERYWKNGNINEYPSGRGEHILSFTIHGRKEILSPGRRELILSGDDFSVFFIRAGAPYASRTVLDDETDKGHTVCVKFSLTDEKGDGILLTDDYLYWNAADSETVQKLFFKVLNLFLGANVDRLKLKSAVFALLGELASLTRENARRHAGFEDISPALLYLDKNYGQNVTIDELARMCFMSNSYFRKRFKEYTGGETFTEFRNRIRVRKARELLDDQLWSIDSIAQVCGFYDASHFYRVYKKYTGHTPSGHSRAQKQQ